MIFANIIKEQITLDDHAINITGRTFFHNFEKTLPEQLEIPPHIHWQT